VEETGNPGIVPADSAAAGVMRKRQSKLSVILEIEEVMW
jgi:hypothetical protein